MNELAVSNDPVRVIAWTLLHFFWQGALVAAALAAALTLLRRSASHLRYGVACGALAVMAAMPVATGLWLSSPEPATSAGSDLALAGGPAGLAAPATAGSPPFVAAAVAPSRAPSTASPLMNRRLDPILPWLVVMWLAGVTALSGVHLGGWVRVRRLRQRGVRQVESHWRRSCASLAGRLGIRRPVELLASTRVAVPTVIGWLKPVVLFPASTFTGLDPRQLESILAHELAHVRRHDYLINVLQVAMETLLFYHPAVWWASRQVRELREHCCDDLAVAVCGDRMIYARALADLEELRFAAPVFALGADGGSLLERIRRLAGARPADQARAPGWLATVSAALALAASAAILAFAGRPGLAQEEDIGIGSPTPLPPVIIAQVAEEERGSSGTRSAAEQTAARPANAESTSRLPIPLDDLIEMKIHGLDDLLDEVEGTAYADLPTQQLLEMARFGVDSELIAELDAAGYRDLQADELIELAKFGIDGELISELGAAGFGDLSAGELVELAKFGIDGYYIQEMSGAGYQIVVIQELVELAKFGVDGELIEELAELGYPDLAAEDIVELAKHGVDGDFIRELRDAGFENLSVDDLTRMARHGIDAEFLSKMSERERI